MKTDMRIAAPELQPGQDPQLRELQLIRIQCFSLDRIRRFGLQPIGIHSSVNCSLQPGQDPELLPSTWTGSSASARTGSGADA